MNSLRRKFLYSLLVGISLLMSCVSGLDPIPSDIKDLSMSWSIPIGILDIKIPNLYSIGQPNYWLDKSVPDWAKYEEVYYKDSVGVDLSSIYKDSSNVKYLAFKIYISNEYVAKCKVNMYFVDESDNTIYSFDQIDVEQGKITSALLQGQNVVFAYKPGTNFATITFDRQQIGKLDNVRFLKYFITIDLKHGDPYTFKDWKDLKFNCHIGARIDFTFN